MQDDGGGIEGGRPYPDWSADPRLADRLIDRLIEARNVALALDEQLLRRLIDAVLLEAARSLAHKPANDG